MAAKKTDRELDLIKALAEILDSTELTEIEMKRDGVKIRVSKQTGGGGQTVFASAPAAAPTAAAAAPAAPAATPMPGEPAKADHANATKSPMVGTCYLRPSPDADLFAEIGSQVKEGDTILLVEAMKTFNPITADKSGTLSAVFVQDASPVEFGDSLFVID